MKLKGIVAYKAPSGDLVLNIDSSNGFYQVKAEKLGDGFNPRAFDADGHMIPREILQASLEWLNQRGYPTHPDELKTTHRGSESLKRNEFGPTKHYEQDENGDDLIARWSKRYSIEEFRALMWAMMEKYNDRLGKKDTPAKEVAKIADYATRWAEVERGKS